MTKKILIVGAGKVGKADMSAIKQKYGADVELLTPEQALEQGVKATDFEEIPVVVPFKVQEIDYCDVKTGRENRRERRAKDRKKK